MERIVAGGWRTRVRDNGRARHIVVLTWQQVRLEVQDTARQLGMPGDEG